MLSHVTLEWKKYQSSGRKPSPVYMILLAVRCFTGWKVAAAGSGVGVSASTRASNEPSRTQSFAIMEKAPIRAFSWLDGLSHLRHPR